MPVEIQLHTRADSLSTEDFTWSVWHCRNTVAYDVSGYNGKNYLVTQMDRYYKYQTKQYTHTSTLVVGKYLAG